MEVLTPDGMGGIAVLSARGAQRASLLALLQRSDGRPLQLRPGAPPVRARVVLDGVAVDDALALQRADGAVELHVHGSPALVELLSERLGGRRRAEPQGAQALLQAARSEAQLAAAVEQLGFDFSACMEELGALPGPRRAAAGAVVLRRSVALLALFRPCRVVLIGRQNAGKSTLLNRLLLRERALVGPQRGLTRDSVAEVTELAGYPFELIDTAGEGEAASAVDQAAIERARAASRAADCALLVVDGSLGPGDVERRLLGERTLVVATKQDLAPAAWPADFPCAIKASCGAQPSPNLRTEVGEALRRLRGLLPAGPVGGPAATCDRELAALQALVGGAG